VPKNDVKLVIVDYLQLMRSPEYAENRVQEISDISRSLKALARELEVPVIALSQLSRASEQRGGERTTRTLRPRDSGAIEQDADVVIFIHRPEMYKDQRDKAEEKGESLDGKADILIASTAMVRQGRSTCISRSSTPGSITAPNGSAEWRGRNPYGAAPSAGTITRNGWADAKDAAPGTAWPRSLSRRSRCEALARLQPRRRSFACAT